MIALIIILLLNAFFFPNILEKQVTEVGYNDFIAMLDAGEVREVAMEDDVLIFVAEKNGQEGYYKTGLWPDDDWSIACSRKKT